MLSFEKWAIGLEHRPSTDYGTSSDYSSIATHLDWVLSDPLSHKIGRAQQQSTVQWENGKFGIRPEQIQKTHANYINWWSRLSMSFAPVLFPQLISMASWETFQDQLTEEQKLRSDFEHFLYI